MTANTALRITELDYDQIRANLKDYLRSQSQFTDYDFEGSGMAILLDILAYNTHYMAMNLNLVGNEMFLDTAQLRASVISHAKSLNYVPTSRYGATANVNIKVTPGQAEDNTATSLTLSKFTRFLSSPKDGKSYNFVNLDANTASKTSNGTFEWANVTIRQGEVITNSYLVDQNNTKRRFLLPTANVDTSTISVLVQESQSNNYSTTYIQSDDITEVTANSTVYWLEENSDANGTFTLYFGDGVLGKYLQNNNIVIVNYLDTQSIDANKLSTFNAVDGIGAYDANVIVTTVSSSYGGSEKESIEQIRFRAPKFYNIQNRAVTVSDYEILLPKDYPNIQSVNVWGGEDNVPPIYGKVFISLKPVDNYEFSLLEKQRIIDQIVANRSVLTVTPEIVDPDYTYLLIQATVYYNPNLTVNSEGDIKTLVQAAISDYRTNELQKFGSTFKKSKLQRTIEDCHEAITSSSVTVYLQKRFEPSFTVPTNYTLSYFAPLYKSGSLNRLYSFPEAVITDSNGVQRNQLIEEVPDSFTGVDFVNVATAGSGYTETPTVTITGDGAGATAHAVLVNGKVQSIVIDNRGSNYSRAFAAITGGGGSGASATVSLEARNGTLRTYYFKTDTGEKVITNSNVGTIDYDLGIVTLTSFLPLSLVSNIFYDNETLTVNIQPNGDTIPSVRNEILDIDETDTSAILITMVQDS